MSAGPRREWDIQVDGKTIKSAITADLKEGYVLHHKLDDDGRPVLNDEGTDIVILRTEGTVEVRIA